MIIWASYPAADVGTRYPHCRGAAQGRGGKVLNQTEFHIWVLLLPRWETLGKPLNLSAPSFPNAWSRNKVQLTPELLRALDTAVHTKGLAQGESLRKRPWTGRLFSSPLMHQTSDGGQDCPASSEVKQEGEQKNNNPETTWALQLKRFWPSPQENK